MATGYGLDDEGVRVWVPVGSRTHFFISFQTSSGAHPVSYAMGTGVAFGGGGGASSWLSA
jgi:hypothetical protein